MSPRTRWLLLVFAAAGFTFSLAASYVHYKLLTVPNYVSPCDINATFNCSAVYLSQYGAVRGVSVALLGVVFFGVVALVVGLGAGKRNSSEDAATTYVFALSTLGLAAVLYFAWVSFFVLKNGCVLCLGVYASVAGLFITSGIASSLPMARLPARLGRDLAGVVKDPTRLLVALLFVVLATTAIGSFPKESSVTGDSSATASTTNATDKANFDEAWAKQPRVDLGIPADGAKVVVVKFNDWQCPSCKAAYYAYKSLLDKYAETMSGAVKVITKDYPLNSRCNFNIPTQMHPGACEAAAAARLAAERHKAEPMIDWLFSHQEGLTPETVKAQVKTLLGIDDFDREYTRVLPDIKRDAADGNALHVQYTPTYYVNGVKAQLSNGSWLPVQYFDYAIQYELEHSGQPPTSSK
jgi:uncharacterized membrane protein/protein-disulfide isomerase